MWKTFYIMYGCNLFRDFSVFAILDTTGLQKSVLSFLWSWYLMRWSSDIFWEKNEKNSFARFPKVALKGVIDNPYSLKSSFECLISTLLIRMMISLWSIATNTVINIIKLKCYYSMIACPTMTFTITWLRILHSFKNYLMVAVWLGTHGICVFVQEV